MADIEITIEGARGSGKTTFAKYLYNHLANSTYVVESVQDSNTVSTSWIQNLRQILTPIRRLPRSISIRVIERGFSEEILEDQDSDL